jgi:hypothetical protein
MLAGCHALSLALLLAPVCYCCHAFARRDFNTLHVCPAAARARLLALLRPSLGGLLWRSSKADVAHELGLPPQVGGLVAAWPTSGS